MFSEAITRNIRVRVQSQLVPERSSPSEHHWFFIYKVVIANEGGEPVKLLSRHWIITDASGRVEEVKGEGVVGEQPELAPGESFEYVSACPLHTPFGVMHGSYQMTTPGGAKFDAEIAPFPLGEPTTLH